jgi:hypothetical protein
MISTIVSPTIALQQQYVPSLLKIESVVPTRLTAHGSHRNINIKNSNKFVHRSYSTLSNSSTISYKNVSKKVNTNLRRHKNHYLHENNGYFEPNNKNVKIQKNTQAGSSIVFESGICKVCREHKEGYQSDRINLDRRGNVIRNLNKQ